MDLPKNIIQIGKPDKLHKIFVEDYVISYIKQLNRKLKGRTAGLAFYGRRCIEDNVRYYFLYGASQVTGLEGRGQYLSELERESVEEKQREYFEGYDFLAWCSISGELPDGFYLHEQGKGLLINGYACFYEKNECMLNYMLVTGNEERAREQEAARGAQEAARFTAAGSIDKRLEERQKAEIRQRPEERYGSERHGPEAPQKSPLSAARAESISRKQRAAAAVSGKPPKGTSGFKFAVVTAAVILCILGITTLNDADKLKELQVLARQVIENLSEKKLPDIGEEGSGLENPPYPGSVVSGSDSQSGSTAGTGGANPDQNNGSENVQSGQDISGTTGSQTGQENGNAGNQENQSGTNSEGQNTGGQDTGTQNTGTQNAGSQNVDGQGETASLTGGQESAGTTQLPADNPENPPAESESPAAETEAQVKTVTYVIAKGDTLLNICRSKYGSADRLQEICSLNNITNADDIKIGQIILLPE